MDDNNVTPFFYKHQFRSVILQFMQLFAWLSVNQAKPGQPQKLVGVPVHYGLKDRVAAAILAGNTQNSVMRLPSMAVNLSGIDLAPERLKGYGVPSNTKILPYGGQFPDDIKTTIYAQPVPLHLRFSVSIMSTNLDEKYQILEQILGLFSRNYQVQIQTSVDGIVANKIVSVEMDSIANESTYPPGADRRSIIHELQFKALVYFSAPSEEVNTLIKSIRVRLAAIEQMDITDEAASDIEGYVFDDMTLIDLNE